MIGMKKWGEGDPANLDAISSERSHFSKAVPVLKTPQSSIGFRRADGGADLSQ